MYWNEIGLKKELICYKLNSNIRCIEIKFYEVSTSDEQVE